MGIFYQDTACAMLMVSELPDDLQIMLNKADERIRDVPDVCGFRGGGLRSRQAIASIIAAWEASNEANVLKHVDAMTRCVTAKYLCSGIDSGTNRREMKDAGAGQ